MRKIVVGLTVILAVFCLASVAYAGSSTLSFSGGDGSILLITSAPGITIDNFEVSGGGSFSAIQQVSVSSPTIIVRDGEFSGGGFIRVITDTANPQVQFGAYLASGNTGYLGQSVTTGSSVEFLLSAQGSGSGNLEIFTDTEERLDFQFNLIYDTSTMDAIASADPFHLSWITQFDTDVQIGGVAWAD